jgi:Cu/Ag efflux protein CusF
MKSFKVWSGIAVLTSGMALSACSAHKEVPPPPPPTVSVSESKTPQGGEIQQTITATAAVQKIDKKTRMVTLKGSDGKTKTIHVSDEVKNLDQVKKGDLVTIAYYESIAYELKKKGTAEPSVNAAADASRASAGSMPGAVGGAAVSVTARITKIDKKTDTVTLKGPKGKTVEVKVKDPTRLENVKVGDLVEITYTEAMAISVDKAPKK